MLNWPVLLAELPATLRRELPRIGGESRSFATLRMTVLKVVGWELAGEWEWASGSWWLGAGGWGWRPSGKCKCQELRLFPD